jgi:hypothetical protein
MTDRSNRTSYEELKAQVTILEDRLAELTASLPAHSLSPSMLIQLEDLEERLEAMRRDLAHLNERQPPPPAE